MLGHGGQEQMLKDSLRVFMGGFADQNGLKGRKQWHFENSSSRVPVNEAGAVFSARIGARDLVFLATKHKVSQGYSPADDNAGSFTRFEMTVSKGTE